MSVQDVELGKEYKLYGHADDSTEHEALLPGSSPMPAEDELEPSSLPSSTRTCGLCWPTKALFGFLHLYFAFLAGVFGCVAMQYLSCGKLNCFSRSELGHFESPHILAPPYVGSTERHPFPPATPTNAFPSLFPTEVGYPGGTATGAEAALIATAPAYPLHTGAAQLVTPATLKDAKSGKKHGFDLFKKWGNLSPWFSVERGAFGLDSGPEAPETCRITGLHLLHRHGARYPTAWGQRFVGHSKLVYIDNEQLPMEVLPTFLADCTMLQRSGMVLENLSS